MTDLARIRFFLTPVHDCSYIPGQKARTLFMDPDAELNPELYSRLSRLGFRRSGRHVYRPHCDDCEACIPVRVDATAFSPRRRQKRIARRNTDLDVQSVKPGFNDERYALYERYIRARHSDGDMYPPSPEQFSEFLLSSWSATRFLEFRHQGQLLAVAVTDEVEGGLSALYSFFDPDMSQRSLGVHAILWQIQAVRDKGLRYLYLGYWVRESQKMRYKIDYRPLEMLLGSRWVRLGQELPELLRNGEA